MKKERIHDMSVESPIFEDFILSCLNNVNMEHNYSALERTNEKYDFVAVDGVFGISQSKTYIEIKYSDNYDLAISHIKDNINLKQNVLLVIIGLWEQERSFDNIIICGKRFIKELINKYSELYWCFAAANDNDAKIQIINNGTQIRLQTRVLGLEECPPTIDINEINKIQLSNIHEFIRLSTYDKKSPAIICGNGISIPFGSDLWSKLTNSIFDYLSPYYIDNTKRVLEQIGNSNYISCSMAIHYLKDKTFIKSLRDCIYRKYDKERMHTEYTLLHAVAESKYNFPSMPLLTYNYDNFIENDLEIYHKTFNISSVFSKRSDGITLEPKIKHVHGLLIDKMVPEDKNIVLSSDQYFSAYRTREAWTYRCQYDVLFNNTCLFVGSSMSDLYQMSVIDDVKKKYEENNKGIWKCFALICLKNLSTKDKISIINYYMSKGIYLIFVDKFEELPAIYNDIFNEISQLEF